jgi:glycosyltransferase involved in cell wall biosynthesis
MAGPPPDIIYLGRSRLHRPRANLLQTLHTVAGFVEEGWTVQLYLPPWRGVDVKQFLRDMGITVPLDLRGTPLLHRRWGGKPFVVWHRRLLQACPAVYVRAPELSLPLARAGIRHHFEVHDTTRMTQNHQLAEIVDYHRAGVIDQLIPISRAARRVLIDHGAQPERLHVAPSGVALERFLEIPPLDPARLARPRLIYIGRISRNRGLTVFEALAQRGYSLTLIGALSPKDRTALPIHPPVPHRDVPSWYGRAELALMPYQADLGHADSISPLKLFEAMAAGRPVIVSDLGPLREVVKDGENGLLVKADDVAAWVAAVDRLGADPDLAQRLAHNARRLTLDRGWRQRARGIARAIGLDHADA